MTLSFGSPVRFLALPISGASGLGTCIAHMQIAPFAIEQKPLEKVTFLKGMDRRRFDAVQPILEFWTPRVP